MCPMQVRMIFSYGIVARGPFDGILVLLDPKCGYS